MVDNWVRLGLITVDYQNHLSGADTYNWADERPEYKRLKSLEAKQQKIEIVKGALSKTKFGENFSRAIS